jgi:uncharacterized protein (TIGR03083 family)
MPTSEFALPLATYIDAIEIDGDLLATAAEKTSLDADIPSCPGWTVRDLLKHITYVHSWAAGYVAEALTKRVERLSEAEVMQSASDDSTAIARFRDGYNALARTLSGAPPDLNCWTFLEAPSPLIFWARRQAHETAIHRVDAELARGAPSPFPAAFAADGIDELLMGFARRDKRELIAETARTLILHATDVGASWSVRFAPEGGEVERGSAAGDCTVSGPAVALYLLLWNRSDASIVEVTGDRSPLDAWRSLMQVTWS